MAGLSWAEGPEQALQAHDKVVAGGVKPHTLRSIAAITRPQHVHHHHAPILVPIKLRPSALSCVTGTSTYPPRCLDLPAYPTCSPSALRLHDRYVRISTTDTLSSSCVTLSMKLLFRDPTSCAAKHQQAWNRQAGTGTSNAESSFILFFMLSTTNTFAGWTEVLDEWLVGQQAVTKCKTQASNALPICMLNAQRPHIVVWKGQGRHCTLRHSTQV